MAMKPDLPCWAYTKCLDPYLEMPRFARLFKDGQARRWETLLVRMPDDHKVLLGRGKNEAFLSAQMRAFLSPEEVAFLNRYGFWLAGLESGTIQPTTTAQSHFVTVACKAADPETDSERLWCKFKHYLKLEDGTRRQQGEYRYQYCERVPDDLSDFDAIK